MTTPPPLTVSVRIMLLFLKKSLNAMFCFNCAELSDRNILNQISAVKLQYPVFKILIVYIFFDT